MSAFAAATPPSPFDPARAARTFESLAERGFTPRDTDRPLFAAIFGNSPFLARLAIRDHAILPRLLADGPDAAVADANTLALSAADAESQTEAMSRLRIAKRRAALAIAAADIAGLWPLETVTRALTDFADACVKGALRFVLRDAAARAALPEQDGATLEHTTGLTVLAMGKYGAFELNYSSDIDLVVFYDPARFPFRKRDDARGAAVDLVRGIVKLLTEMTSDGYVFRTDLRLRPDAGATQVAISVDAAESYYEGMGQNWERAAFIKARACAGDPETGARFLKAIEPFIWRRNLDYAAIEDIHSIKRQIHAHGGHGAIAVAGHNIKLGRGGIREIEFFAQTQQLILGGRVPMLRSSRTTDALDALNARGLVSNETTADLKHAYRYLRTLEHRLQMIEDEQTHTVPKSLEGIAHVACFMGYPDAAEFGAALTAQLEAVQGHYARLFEWEQELTASEGDLVFTGVEEDPGTLGTLQAMGFRDAAHVSGAIRGWHHGRIRATRSARARELLTKLVPALLPALAATADPDAAFTQFDRFLTNLPAGVQLFSQFLARPEFLRLVAAIVGSAPRLAEHLSRAPATLDALIDADFLRTLPSRATLDAQLRDQLARAADYEGALDAARRFAKEQIFRVGVQIIQGTANAAAAGPALANIAEAVIAGLLPAVEAALAETAGRIPGARFAVVAMGKLGGREMTAGSDLDLVFIYDVAEGTEHSDGAKPLPVIVYYARLAQRLIAALTVHTAAGGLYEVDMRLRPTGNKGPVAVSLASFARYHAEESWTWERMALTRARVIAAPQDFANEIEAVIRTTLTAKTERAKIVTDARDMRDKLAQQFPGKNRWDLKFAPGGLVDIEFVAQTLQLCTASAHPEALDTNTIASLRNLEAAGALSPADAQTLIAAADLEHALTQVLRIALDGTLDPAHATAGLKALLVRAANAKDIEDLETRLVAAQKSVREILVATFA
ncbi:MAG TPA: bifunctional [glutamine synthetase] adenylyltransferase/[glutamine synthetase]-adenylyl-L-tyrosine phosphorylase [Rhizomicrobium sp.]|jgi:glutamate-ammonia-ligase adenylyltransferase|nr:bifunctional [glutamine synthetase] adenylyltransferase/[glutamine synthetase]-adenylyl-L-tyrosine phosphorylase [Rhizomicrobium sp.]